MGLLRNSFDNAIVGVQSIVMPLQAVKRMGQSQCGTDRGMASRLAARMDSNYRCHQTACEEVRLGPDHIEVLLVDVLEVPLNEIATVEGGG